MSAVTTNATSRPYRSPNAGFSLIELMIAVLLGILLSIGLVTLFGATSKTNRVQDAMSQMQENGRFAVSRLTNDLRLISRQQMNTSGYLPNAPGANGAISTVLAPQVYVDSIPFPDGGVSQPTGWDTGNAMSWWPLSPRFFLQGYDCSSGTCSPADPPGLPVMDIVATTRVRKADALTLRYQSTSGWSYYAGEFSTLCNGPNLTSVTITSPTSNFQPNDLALLTSSGFSEIFQVNVAGTLLTPINVHNGGNVPCLTTAAATEVNLYNFSRDFITATYWLRLDVDNNAPGRVIPTLVRRQANNVPAAVPVDQALVQGVERLDLLYGMQASDGSVTYMAASDVAGSTVTCPTPPLQYQPPNLAAGTMEPGCMWRAVKSVETHLLLDSVNNMFELTNPDMTYNYSFDSTVYDGTGSAPTTQQGGIPFGKMMRREFVSLTSLRNFNP